MTPLPPSSLSDPPLSYPQHQAQICKENTFQLGPHSRFQPKRAREIAQQVVGDLIRKESNYSAEWARVTALKITDQVQTELKQQKQDRYKFVVQSFIGQKSGQGLMLGSRCLSDPDTDSYTEFSFNNSSLWCTVLIYALYCE
ncbi:Tctex1 domain-containing protein 1 [Elysia marginata]|uniref:Tctex1 domain-containing protein 1 n=1 Tax=Elysia marginata TaxID=1093978 RepID=A0AAV4EX65_9GAST|nr:Tctex1 domain-containing protein 1 [Elysia marginata]